MFSFEEYGKVINKDASWMIDSAKMDKTNNAKFMHCLPVRRNVVVHDDVLDSPNSLVIDRANQLSPWPAKVSAQFGSSNVGCLSPI